LDKNIQRTSHGLLLSHWNGYSHFSVWVLTSLCTCISVIEISRECNDIIGSAKGSQISEKYWREVGKGKRVDVYLEVRKRRGYIFFEWNKCPTGPPSEELDKNSQRTWLSENFSPNPTYVSTKYSSPTEQWECHQPVANHWQTLSLFYLLQKIIGSSWNDVKTLLDKQRIGTHITGGIIDILSAHFCIQSLILLVWYRHFNKTWQD
jgi:hypothetical protein